MQKKKISKQNCDVSPDTVILWKKKKLSYENIYDRTIWIHK